jgi:hypothetical protein
MGCNEQFPREAAVRSDQVKWEKIQHSKDMAPEWQVKRLLLRSTGGLPVTYRHSLCSALEDISASILKLPLPAFPGTTCKQFEVQKVTQSTCRTPSITSTTSTTSSPGKTNINWISIVANENFYILTCRTAFLSWERLLKIQVSRGYSMCLRAHALIRAAHWL